MARNGTQWHAMARVLSNSLDLPRIVFHGNKRCSVKRALIVLPQLKVLIPADENSFTYLLLKGQRWITKLTQLNQVEQKKQIGRATFSKSVEIASAGNARVFLGLYGATPVAVKRVNTEHVGRELEIYKSLKDKTFDHVLKTFFVEEDDDFSYFVTELCEYNIREIIEERNIHISLTDKRRNDLCLDFLKGLQELHNCNILHRDLKPENVLVGMYSI